MGLLSSLFGGGTPKTQTTKSEPWAEQIPYLTGPAGNPHLVPQPSNLWMNALQSLGQGYVRPMPGMTASTVPTLDPYGQMLAGITPTGPEMPAVDYNQISQPNAALNDAAAKAWQEYQDARNNVNNIRMNWSRYYSPERPGRTMDWRNAQDRLEKARSYLESSGLMPSGANAFEIAEMVPERTGVPYQTQNSSGFGQPINTRTVDLGRPLTTMPVAGTSPVALGGPTNVMSGYQGTQPYESTTSTPGVMPSAAQWYQGPGEQYFPGPSVTGRTPGQYFGDVARTLAGLQQVETARALQPQLEDMYGKATGAIGNIFTGDVPTNPYFDAAMKSYADEAINTLRETRLPSIAREALGHGLYGSARQGLAEAEAIKGAQEAISTAGSQLAHQDYANYLQALQDQQRLQASAASNIPSLFGEYMTARNMPASALSELGRTTTGIGKEYQDWGNQMLTGEQNRWNFYQKQPYDMLQRYANLIGRPAGSTEVTPAPQGRSPFGSALSGASMGASIGSTVPVLGSGLGALLGAGLGVLGGI